MTTLLLSLAIAVMTIVLILMSKCVNNLYKEIGELKEKLEHHRINLKFLNTCELDHENRLDQLEEVLELKEYFDEEPLNEEENE